MSDKTKGELLYPQHQASTLYQHYKNNHDPFSSSPVTLTFPLLTSSGENIAPSSHSSKINMRKNKRHMEEKGGTQPTIDSHAGCTQPTTIDHVGGKISTIENKVERERERERGKVKFHCKLCT